MWLTNFLNYIYGLMCYYWGNNGTSYAIPAYRKYDGTAVNSREGRHTIGSTGANLDELQRVISLPAGSLSTSQGFNASGSMIFGDGNTAVTAEDYRLSNMITTGLTFSTSFAEVDQSSKTVAGIVTVTATEEHTISEVGYIFNEVLMFRQVLDAPVVLGIGDSASFRLNYSLSGATVAVV